MKLLRVARPFLNQVRNVGEMQSTMPAASKVTQSRDQLARAFPGVVAKQDHHMKMLKMGRPVHSSGSEVFHYITYCLVGATLSYGMYRMYLFARK